MKPAEYGTLQAAVKLGLACMGFRYAAVATNSIHA